MRSIILYRTSIQNSVLNSYEQDFFHESMKQILQKSIEIWNICKLGPLGRNLLRLPGCQLEISHSPQWGKCEISDLGGVRETLGEGDFPHWGGAR